MPAEPADDTLDLRVHRARDQVGARRHDRELLGGDRLARRRRAARCGRARRWSARRPGRRARWSRRTARPARPRPPRPRRRLPPGRRTPPPSAPRTASAARRPSRRPRPQPASTRATAAASTSSSSGAPATCTRSRNPWTCGEMYAPATRPCACRMAAANSVVDVLPLVPTTWIARNARCGSPSAVSSSRMRSSPSRMPNAARVASRSSSPATYPASSARRASRRLDLAAEPLGALALLGHHGRRRAVDEARVGELRLRLGQVGDALRRGAVRACRAARRRARRRRPAPGRRRPRPARPPTVVGADEVARPRPRQQVALRAQVRRVVAAGDRHLERLARPEAGVLAHAPQLGDQLDHRRHGARRLGVLGARPATGNGRLHQQPALARAGTARSPRSRTASPGAAAPSTRSSTNSAVSDACRRAAAIVAVEPDLERPRGTSRRRRSRRTRTAP